MHFSTVFKPYTFGLKCVHIAVIFVIFDWFFSRNLEYCTIGSRRKIPGVRNPKKGGKNSSPSRWLTISDPCSDPRPMTFYFPRDTFIGVDVYYIFIANPRHFGFGSGKRDRRSAGKNFPVRHWFSSRRPSRKFRYLPHNLFRCSSPSVKEHFTFRLCLFTTWNRRDRTRNGNCEIQITSSDVDFSSFPRQRFARRPLKRESGRDGSNASHGKGSGGSLVRVYTRTGAIDLRDRPDGGSPRGWERLADEARARRSGRERVIKELLQQLRRWR